MNEELSLGTGAGIFALDIRNARIELLAKGKSPAPEIDPHEKAQILDVAVYRTKRKYGLSYAHPEKRISKKEQAFMDLVGKKADEEWTSSDIYKQLQRSAHLHSTEDWLALEAEAKKTYIEGAKKFGLFLLKHGDGCLNAYKTDEERAEAVAKQFTLEFTKAFHFAFAYGSAATAIRFAGEAYRYDSDVLDDALNQRDIDPKEDLEGYHQTVEDLIKAVPSKKKGKNAPVLDDVGNYRKALATPSKPEKEEIPKGKPAGSSPDKSDGDGESSGDEEAPNEDKPVAPPTPVSAPKEPSQPKPDGEEKPESVPPEKPTVTPPPPDGDDEKPDTPSVKPVKEPHVPEEEPVVVPPPKPNTPQPTPEKGKDAPPETPDDDGPSKDGEILPPEKPAEKPEKEPVIIDGEIVPPGTALVPYQDHPLTAPGFDHNPLRTYVELTRRERYIVTELLESLGYEKMTKLSQFRAHIARYWKRRLVLSRQFKMADESLANFKPVAEKVARMLFEVSFSNYDVSPETRLENFFDARRYTMGRKKIPVEISGNWQKKFNDSISRILDDAMDGHSENYPWYSSARNAHQLSLAVQVLTKNGYDMKSYLRGTKIDRSGKPIISKWVRKAESDLEICAEHALTGLIGRLQNWIHEANKDGSDEASRIFIDMYRFGVGLFNNVGILFIDTSTYAQTEKEYIGLGLVTKEKTKKIWRDMKESRGSAFDSIRKTLHNWSIDLQDWWSGY